MNYKYMISVYQNLCNVCRVGDKSILSVFSRLGFNGLAAIPLMLLSSMVYQGKAQTHILLRNDGLKDGKLSVEAKWFTQAVVQDRSVYLFRKEVTQKDWVLLVSQAFKVQANIPAPDKAKDKELITYEQLIMQRKQQPINGIMLLALWVKAIQSQAFAQFLGIYHKDTTVELGKTYQYCLKYSNNPYDPNVLVSSEVKVTEQGGTLSPVQNFQVNAANKKEVGFIWKIENLRFWAVNIYRKRSDEVGFRKINKDPLIVNDYQSEDAKQRRNFLATDDSLREGGLYFYKINPVDFFGNEGQPSEEVPFFIPDRSSPSPVTLYKDSAHHQKVWLRWSANKDKDLKGYHIYRSLKNDANYSKITSKLLDPSVGSYIDNLVESGDYYYFVSAVDTASNESPSNKIIANVEDVMPPAIPKGLHAKSDTGRIRLQWTANQEKDLAGYYVYRGVKGQPKRGMVLLTARPVRANGYVDTINRVATNRYIYAIASVDTMLNVSETSDTAGAAMPDIIPPDKPYIKSVRMHDGKMDVDWMAGREPDLLGFEIFLTTLPEKEGKYFSKKVGAELRNVSLNNPYEGAKTYKVYIQAFDASNNRSERSQEYLIYADDSRAKTQDWGMVKLKGTLNKKKNIVLLDWDYEGKWVGASKYMLFQKSKEGEFKPLTGFMADFKFQCNDLNPGEYQYQVRRYLPDGVMLKSNVVEIKIP